MKLFDKFKPNKVELDETPVAEKKNNSTPPITINKNKMKDFIIKAVGGILNQSDTRERFQRPEYNL